MAQRERPSLLANLLARLGGSAASPPPVKEAPRPFQAIAIYRAINSCAMAKKFSEHRFLAKDAPTLPLVGCTMAATCQCRYLKYKDRRAGERRVIDFGSMDRGYSGKDRRALQGRGTRRDR